MRALSLIVSAAFILSGCGRHASVSATPTPASIANDAVVRAGNLDSAIAAVSHFPYTAADRKHFTTFLAHNRTRPETYEGQTIRRIINLEIAYEDGVSDDAAAQDQEESSEHAVAKYLDVRVLSADDANGRRVIFSVRLHNKSAKQIRHIDIDVVVADAQTKHAVGHMVLNIDCRLPAHGTIVARVPVRYGLFGAEAAAMTGEATRTKHFIGSPQMLDFTDGTHIGAETD